MNTLKRILEINKKNAQILDIHKKQLIVLTQTIKDMNEIYKMHHGKYLLENEDFKYIDKPKKEL